MGTVIRIRAKFVVAVAIVVASQEADESVIDTFVNLMIIGTSFLARICAHFWGTRLSTRPSRIPYWPGQNGSGT